ncbi:DNA-binding transcriptional regulator, MerR family [Lutimaribacter pacificus]|uniref:Transcriptional regulator, MerR family n=1 Tax=Lutimaribacter pacificus TaxID=391948 RepID=A0A1H0GWS0_9RHOB|nr:helix-turn-helix domain-containing protein [Lutimaribacter pacificus]SDO11486.1 DNA-binding transcriptional regulator, MerR family [Lutimaribacter pacificus]SHJ93020.1 transcriptional regulator, MerR family [Lutimaribacter pacificus]
MFSIGQLSQATGVKVPTIRYYEDIGLLPCDGRSAGNQRRYSVAGRDRLRFIAHARALGLPLDAIRALLDLSGRDGAPCRDAHAIAGAHLADIRDRIARLTRLERELERITQVCDHDDGPCRLLEALADHDQCSGAH